jgi:hypothetical protein
VLSVGTKSAVTAYVPAFVCVVVPPVRILATVPGTELALTVTVALLAEPL